MIRPAWLPEGAGNGPICAVHPADYPTTGMRAGSRVRLKADLAKIGISLYVTTAIPIHQVRLWDPEGAVNFDAPPGAAIS